MMAGGRRAGLAVAACLLVTSAAAEGWLTVSPPGDGFAADFPALPVTRVVVETESSTAVERFRDYRLTADEGTFFVDAIRLSAFLRDALSDAEVLAFALGLVAPDCEQGTPREIAMAGTSGHEATFRCPAELTMRMRILIDGPWLYQVAAAGGPGFITVPDSVRFLDSFRLVPR
jgi:hypothetical protein